MLHFTYLILLIGYIHAIQVKVDEGILEGEIVNSKFGFPYYSFKGIRYAEPPINELRFKAPKPVKPWSGVKEAKELGSLCFQYSLYESASPPATGSEDCLFLNVFSPNITRDKAYPVMVWVHGGGFVGGSSDKYEPDFIVRKDVILVTLNYRLDMFGFLNLETEDIPGNAAMKDQVEALRWVKRNIKYFGGDPDNVTVFGQSAGGASVSYLLISPMTKGLFKRAITQSGSAHCWWPNTYKPKERAVILAREMGCNSTDDKEIANFFKTQPAEAFIKRKILVTMAQSFEESPNVFFGITSEKNYGDNEVFLQGDIYDVLRRGIHEGVDVINGYTEDDGSLYLSRTNYIRIFEQANKFLEFFVPEPLTLNVPVVEQLEIGKKMREFYMQGERCGKQNIDKLLKYFNFEVFVFGALSWQKFIATNNNSNNIYLYKFTCKSERNIVIHGNNTKDLFDHRVVVAHGDDVRYLFPLNIEVDMNSKTFELIDRLTTLWTNFAKYGVPTPGNSLGVQWSPYTLINQQYLDIGNKLVLGSKPDQDQLTLWEDIFRKYYPHVLA